jgi:hypothetical protein
LLSNNFAHIKITLVKAQIANKYAVLLPVDVGNCKGFGQEYEREDDTDGLTKCRNSSSEEGTKLADDSKDYLYSQIASQGEEKGVSVGLLRVVPTKVDGGGYVSKHGHKEEEIHKANRIAVEDDLRVTDVVLLDCLLLQVSYRSIGDHRNGNHKNAGAVIVGRHLTVGQCE